ncbi:MAG: hypothetical protein RLZZ252_1802 [Bacteroidota bacterium]|jgi:hypothetical protein
MRKVIFYISQLFCFAYILVYQCTFLHAQITGNTIHGDSMKFSESIENEPVELIVKPVMLPTEESIFSSGNYQYLFQDGFTASSKSSFQPEVGMMLPLSISANVKPINDFSFLDYATPRDPMRIFRKRFFWGIAFAGTQAKMKMELDPVFWQRTDSIKSIRPGGQVGGGFGGSVAMRMGRFWEVKMLTMLQLHERTLQYTWQNTPGPNLKIETISLDIPLTLKYRSSMPNNTGMYIIGGVRWSHDFQSNEDVPIGDTKPLIAIKKNTYYYEMGAGFEFRLDFVDLSLEFKLSNGLNNALVRIPNSYYSGSLSAIYPRLFSISLMAQD